MNCALDRCHAKGGSARIAALALAIAFVGLTADALASQSMIVLSPTSVQQGQAVKVSALPCSTPISILLDGNPFPLTPEGDNTFAIATSSLAPKEYAVTTRCGDVTSQAVTLSVVSGKEIPDPTVTCARNVSPRDGKPEAPFPPSKADDGENGLSSPGAVPEWSRCEPGLAWNFRLEDSLSIQAAGYSNWIRVANNKAKPLHLFIDGIELPNLTLNHSDASGEADTLRTILRFESDATAKASRDAWTEILRTARAKAFRGQPAEVDVSVGPAGGPQWRTTAKIRITSYPTGLTVFAGISIAILLGLLGWKAATTGLLRDNSAEDGPYSLARCQMACWFIVIVSAFLFVTVTTGQAAAMSSTALILIGISGATGLIAASMDSNKQFADVTERRALESEQATLKDLIDGPDGLKSKRQAAAEGSAEAVQIDAALQTKLQRLDVVTRTIEEKKIEEEKRAGERGTSQGWLTDVLSDENGISFHRLQMVVWTVVLVGTFVVAVWRTFAMAEFDTTTLGLLGISSGTYLGFKFPERQAAPAEPAK